MVSLTRARAGGAGQPSKSHLIMYRRSRSGTLDKTEGDLSKVKLFPIMRDAHLKNKSVLFTLEQLFQSYQSTETHRKIFLTKCQS